MFYLNCKEYVWQYVLMIFLVVSIFACTNETLQNPADKKEDTVSCMSVPSRFASTNSINYKDSIYNGDSSTLGMVLINGGEFMMGGDNEQASADEFPKHKVSVSSFLMDATEVTNAQFQKFIDQTGYITISERKPDWEELKKTVPPGTAKPDESLPSQLFILGTN